MALKSALSRIKGKVSLGQLRRSSFLVAETILFGPAYGSFTYSVRSNEPLDPQEAWKRFAEPKSRLVEYFYRNYPPKIFRWLLLHLYYRRSGKFKDHTVGISFHYDLSQHLYGLFLDSKYRFYSCADFWRSTDTLEDAQENKADYILNLIEPKPGEKILELGCGWGGMLKKICERTGDKENLFGYTLSRDEKEFIDRECGFHVELEDFTRAGYEQESFDKMLSIEGLEHVREQELLPLYGKLFNALKPGGRLVLQLFCQMEDFFPTRLLVAGFQIFPGGELTSLRKHLGNFEVANFKVTHLSVHDFRPTMRAWFDRLVANKEAAIKSVGVHNYNRYQCFFAGAWRLFNDHDLVLTRLVLERPNGEAC
jgi:cyclopropane-fatty-acyl-phospholipid synthase